MNNDIIVANGTQVSVSQMVLSQPILNTDRAIPHIYLMQKGSTLVDDDKAKIGELIRSTNGEKVGDSKTPLEVIPFKMTHHWIVNEVTTVGRNRWVRTESRTPQNEHWKWEFEENGKPMERIKAIDLYAILPMDIDARNEEVSALRNAKGLPNLQKLELLPVVINFRSTQMKTAGTKLTGFFGQVQTSAQLGMPFPPYRWTMSLSNSKTEGKDSSWQSYYLSDAYDTKEVYLEVAAQWYNLLNSSEAANLKIDSPEDSPMGTVEVEAKTKKTNGKSQF